MATGSISTREALIQPVQKHPWLTALFVLMMAGAIHTMINPAAFEQSESNKDSSKLQPILGDAQATNKAAMSKAFMECESAYGIPWNADDPAYSNVSKQRGQEVYQICSDEENNRKYRESIRLFKVPFSEANDAASRGLHHLGRHNEVFRTGDGYVVWLSSQDPEFFRLDPVVPIQERELFLHPEWRPQ